MHITTELEQRQMLQKSSNIECIVDSQDKLSHSNTVNKGALVAVLWSMSQCCINCSYSLSPGFGQPVIRKSPACS